MSYSAEISRSNPGCLIFLLDQSGSMHENFGGGKGGRTKSQELADALNRLLNELILACTRTDGIRDYFDTAVLGYHDSEVEPAFEGNVLRSQDILPLSTIALNVKRVADRQVRMKGDGGMVTRTTQLPIWIEPKESGYTPMCQALERVYQIASNWIHNHPDNYPPIVIHITDGEANDGDPVGPALQLTSLATSDGNLLLFNCHISSSKSNAVHFPHSESGLPDNYARQLFQMSSVLPPAMAAEAQNANYRVQPSARGMVFNGDYVDMIQFLDIGTRPVRNLR